MNPFGSSDDENEGQQQHHRQQQHDRNHVSGSAAGRRREKIHYPGDLNPFGEDGEEVEEVDEEDRGRSGQGKWKQVISSSSNSRNVSRNGKSIDVSIKDQSRIASSTTNNNSSSSTHSQSRYNDSLNPFGSDEDEDDDDEYNDSSSITTNSTNATTTEPSSLASGGSATPVPRPRTSLNHALAGNSQPVSRETTPIPLRRSIGSNVSRSSLDSRSRKSHSIVKPSVPPPPAPGSADQSPLRPRRSPKHKPAPRPGNLTPGTTDKWVTVSTVVGIVASESDSRRSNGTPTNAESAENLQQDEVINPDPMLTDETVTTPATESLTSGSSSSSICRVLPVPAVRRISLTPSASEETAISLSSTLDLDHNSQSNSCNKSASSSQADLTSGNLIAQDPNVSLTVSESSPSPSGSFIRLDGAKTMDSGSPSPVRRAMKKRPAPAPPQAIRRTVCGSLNSIQFDLNAIGDRLAVIQGQVNELEAAFRRDATSAAAASATASSTGSHSDRLDQKSIITQYLELARETCTLARKQEELMYQRTEHKLEQEHADLEFNIRKIDLIPEFKRTPDDEKKSKDMIRRLVDVIDQRNDVVENMTKINKRYVYLYVFV